MYSLKVGFRSEGNIVEKEFKCEGFNTDDLEMIFLLDAKENANIIGMISKKELLYLKIKES
jgi:hypothetical protein